MASSHAKRPNKTERALKYARYLVLVERDYAGAVEEYERILRKSRKNHEALLALGQAYGKLGKWDEAASTLKKAARLAPRDVITRKALAKAAIRTGDTKTALAELEAVLELDPRDAEAALAAADLLWVAGDDARPKALERYRQFMENTGLPRGHQARRVEARLAKAAGDPAAAAMIEARATYERAFAARRGMGRMLERSYRTLDSVLEKKPGHPEALYLQGLIHLSVKSAKLHSAEKGIEKLTAAGAYAPALAERARQARREDDLESARALATQATKADEKHQKGWYELGLAQKLAGERKAAVVAFQRAVDLDRETAIAARAVVDLSHLAPSDRRVKRHFRSNKSFEADLFDTEKFKGSIRMLERRLGGIAKDAPEQPWLEEMLRRMLEVSPTKVPTEMSVKVARTKMVNAFAVPNGNLYVTRGFLDFVKKTFPKLPMDVDNPVIAAVMGHEVSHVTKEHVIRSFVFRDALSGQKIDPNVLVSVTRTHEIEADREGMRLMFLAGYDPRWAVDLHVAYARVLGEVPRGLDHPTFDERAHYLEEFWSNEMAFAYASFTHAMDHLAEARKLEATDLNASTKRYQAAIEDLVRFVEAFSRTKEAVNNMALAYARLGLFALVRTAPKHPLTRWVTEQFVDPDLALKFVPLKRQRKTRGVGTAKKKRKLPTDLRKARSLLRRLVREHPEYPQGHANLAFVHLAEEDLSAADTAWGKVLKSCPAPCSLDMDAVYNLGGIVAAEQGRAKDAVDRFERSLAGAEDTPRRVFNLARAQAQAKQTSAALASYRRYLKSYGEEASGRFTVWAKEAVRALEK